MTRSNRKRPMPLCTAAQMRALDEETITRIGVPGAVLMENAGRGVVEVLEGLHERGEIDLSAGQAVVVAGPGNNGGDGMVVARYLHTSGVRVRVLLCGEPDRVRGDALLHMKAAQATGVTPLPCPGDEGAAQVEAVLFGLDATDLIVDALFGTGLTRPVTGTPGRVIEAMNRSPAVKVAVDLPSGMDADRGEPAGDTSSKPAIVRAQHTVTFAFPKIGLCGAPGFTYAGRLTVVDIGIPASLGDSHGVRARLLSESCLFPLRRPLDPLGHKGSHGHLLIVAGSRGKTGAALLCAQGAQHVGVGLCTLASPPGAQTALQGRVLEAMTQTYGAALESDQPADDQAPHIAAELLHLAEGKRALAIGPGLPTAPVMTQVPLRLLREGSLPVVLDADALNLLAGHTAELRAASQRPRDIVLTPHPGEAARLLQRTTAEVQADRTASARDLCQATGCVVVLKGARSVVAAPSGDLSISPTGNAGMGSGGMGDVLTGMTGALLTAGLPAYDAACAAVYWHGLAGDVLAARKPPGSILLAGELCAVLPEALAGEIREAYPRAHAFHFRGT